MGPSVFGYAKDIKLFGENINYIKKDIDAIRRY
jgi:hypothetical protein